MILWFHENKILFSEKLSFNIVEMELKQENNLSSFLASIISVDKKDKLESSFGGIQFINHIKWYYPLRPSEILRWLAQLVPKILI